MEDALVPTLLRWIIDHWGYIVGTATLAGAAYLKGRYDGKMGEMGRSQRWLGKVRRTLAGRGMTLADVPGIQPRRWDG